MAVEEAVEASVQRIGAVEFVRPRLFHQVAQLLARTRVEKVERVVLQGGVDAGVLRQRPGAIGHRRGAQILQAMKRHQLELEIALQVGPRVVRRAALGKENA